MDIKELSNLKNSNYFVLVASVFGGFGKLSDKNLLSYLQSEGWQLAIKKDEQLVKEVHFKHDPTAYCNATFDFDNNGKLVNFRALILPVGYFKKKRAKRYFEQILRLLETIAHHNDLDLIEVKPGNLYRLEVDGLIATVTRAKSIVSDDDFVSFWCERINK